MDEGMDEVLDNVRNIIYKIISIQSIPHLSFLARVFTETETFEPLDILLRMMLAFFTRVLMLLELDCPVAWRWVVKWSPAILGLTLRWMVQVAVQALVLSAA